ncbi:hypothetical protein, partial [Phenylobacterium sp.]|uniref:hypothetical protein n=1 Tax=Phenylobacterium sp. TaxID=1871053 RepID=UPI002FE25C91
RRGGRRHDAASRDAGPQGCGRPAAQGRRHASAEARRDPAAEFGRHSPAQGRDACPEGRRARAQA